MVNSAVAIFGAGGHAKVVADVLRAQGTYAVACFVSREEEDALTPKEDVRGAIVAIGDNLVRRAVVRRIQERFPEMELVTAVHPTAYVAPDVEIGPGTVVMPHAVINAGAKIGSHVIVNTKASIDHDCLVEDFASIGPGATLGGSCRIGTLTAIGLGASVIDKINVGRNTIVGAGAVVVRDVESDVVAYGTPCRSIRRRDAGDARAEGAG